MTYKPKTRAEKWFRWSVSGSREGNRRQKVKRTSWYDDDGWWEEGRFRKIASLKSDHEHEMRNWEDYT